MRISLIMLVSLVAVTFLSNSVNASDFKWIRVGKYQTKIVDSGDQGESAGYSTFGYYDYDAFSSSKIVHAGWHLGVRDWVDEDGSFYPFKISGAGHGSSDEFANTMPVPDAEGVTIRRYFKNLPPTVIVDGFMLNEPFPMIGDEINPGAIPGTADVMVESWINTSMGIMIHQRALGWSQKNHDDYIIFDWTFTNTGNIDLDDELELTGQTLEDVYFW